MIGLTGGIGTGKSRVAALLRELGAAWISADEIARSVMEPGGSAYAEVMRRFGRGILKEDGRIDRRKLGRIVFSDAAARRDLERIVHPLVRAEMRKRRDALAASGASPQVVVCEVPLLFEVGLEQDYDEIWVVRAEADTAVRRVVERDGLTPEEVKDRMRAQWSVEDKARRADVVIDNDGPWSVTERQVRSAWEDLQRRLAAGLERRERRETR